MATLAQLYERLILDTNRDDMGADGELEQAKIDAVSAAINKYKAEQFWFNAASGSRNSSSGEATLVMPAAVFVPNLVSYGGEPLQRVPLIEIEHRIESGLSSRWAESLGLIRLWPIPDASYTFHVYGTADIGAPASASTNIWTTEAYELILAEAKVTLCRGPLRDSEGLSLAKDARDEALTTLRRETRRRSISPLRSDLPLTGGFSGFR